MIQIHSIEHQNYPEKEKPVRTLFNNRGEYVKPIDEKSCKLYLAIKFDKRMSAPVSMMEGKGADSTEKWFKDFLKQLNK